MINLGKETNFWRAHWIFFGQEKLKAENPPVERTTTGAADGYVEIAKIIVMRDSSNAWSRVIHKSLSLFDDSLGQSHYRGSKDA